MVNNAGYTWDSVIQKTTDEQFQAMLDIHIVAPFRLLRAASRWLRETAKKESEAGTPVMRKVVNITSISGLDGNPGQIGYASGKAGIVGLTKTLAKEWGRYNVTVNAVGFGLIDTRLIKPMEDAETNISIGAKQVHVGMQAQVREQAAKMIPLGRLGTPADAANAVFFFCSPLSDYVTGRSASLQRGHSLLAPPHGGVGFFLNTCIAGGISETAIINSTTFSKFCRMKLTLPSR